RAHSTSGGHGRRVLQQPRQKQPRVCPRASSALARSARPGSAADRSLAGLGVVRHVRHGVLAVGWRQGPPLAPAAPAEPASPSDARMLNRGGRRPRVVARRVRLWGTTPHPFCARLLGFLRHTWTGLTMAV
ncbi:unnamed protein product, partial [Ixodes hexagonus]